MECGALWIVAMVTAPEAAAGDEAGLGAAAAAAGAGAGGGAGLTEAAAAGGTGAEVAGVDVLWSENKRH